MSLRSSLLLVHALSASVSLCAFRRERERQRPCTRCYCSASPRARTSSPSSAAGASTGFLHLPCIHTRNILSWRLRLRSKRRSTPSLRSSKRRGVSDSPRWTASEAGEGVDAGAGATESGVGWEGVEGREDEGVVSSEGRALVGTSSPEGSSSSVVVVVSVAASASVGPAVPLMSAEVEEDVAPPRRTPPKMYCSSSARARAPHQLPLARARNRERGERTHLARRSRRACCRRARTGRPACTGWP